MKLRKLHIDDYKMFKDFDISFVDENDEALPIVVLAGVNGSGKTSLLDWIYNEYYKALAKYEFEGILSTVRNNIDSFQDKDTILVNDYFTYLLAGIDNIRQVADEFVKTFYFFLKEKDYRPSEITEHFHNYMKEIFNDLDIEFKYSHLDKEDNVWFSSSENEEYYYTAKKNDNRTLFTIDELSTGEKTLLSKVLYLYFRDYKDKIILIDEPELSLHPSWQNKVLKIYENFAKQNNCQIIIATHSPHIIASAKNEYLRFLIKNKEGKIEAIENITAYGRDIEWVLEQMGVTDTRVPKITKRFNEIQELINNQEFDKAESALDKLEYVIGENDKDILALRNDLAFERIDFEEDN